MKNALSLSSILLMLGALPGCATIKSLSAPPGLSTIGDPSRQEEARLVGMPMPSPEDEERASNSLWEPRKNSFFADQRAQDVGDILTVFIEIEDQARMRNSTARNRRTENGVQIDNFLGLEDALETALPSSFDPASAVDLSSDSLSEGAGEINRNENISLRIAAVVTDELPNGNFVIAGRQEVRVNHELRELRVAGVIRPEDISNGNAIDYSKIAEARVSYGGRGVLSRVQSPRYGQRVYEVLFPF